MDRHFDLVVVGTGVTSAVASRCREAGFTVAVVDSRPFGGTCALRGCVPKKILVSAAEAVHSARGLAATGVPAGTLTIDWPALMRFKHTLVDPTTERTEQTWARMGIERFHGRARFVGPTTLVVGDERLTGRRVLIAAGSVPASLGVSRRGAAHDHRCLPRPGPAAARDDLRRRRVRGLRVRPRGGPRRGPRHDRASRRAPARGL